jgi:hypothetical protein
MKQDQGRLKIRVKYCGGCNPNYDRVALVRRIKERLGKRVAFVEAEDKQVSLVLAVEGCSTACADLSPFQGMEIRVITRPEDAECFLRDLEATLL